jgi:hypothetical protein
MNLAMAKIQLKYFGYHPYNNPTHAERNVELPLAFWFLDKFKDDLGNVIEVGEVTPFYAPPRHTVYDVACEKPATIKMDAVQVEYPGKHLLSISTVEHIGTTDYGQTPNPALLPAVISKMLAAKNYLITFPLGYNSQLEDLVKNERYVILERVAPTQWRQVERKLPGNYKYNSPWFAGNAICVLTNLENLQFEFVGKNWFWVATRCCAANWSWKNFARAARQEMSDRKMGS